MVVWQMLSGRPLLDGFREVKGAELTPMQVRKRARITAAAAARTRIPPLIIIIVVVVIIVVAVDVVVAVPLGCVCSGDGARAAANPAVAASASVVVHSAVRGARCSLLASSVSTNGSALTGHDAHVWGLRVRIFATHALTHLLIPVLGSGARAAAVLRRHCRRVRRAAREIRLAIEKIPQYFWMRYD